MYSCYLVSNANHGHPGFHIAHWTRKRKNANLQSPVDDTDHQDPILTSLICLIMI